jgi:dethiobiotin synthetase
MNAPAYFIAGTDTGVGKTRVTAALLAAARAMGLSISGMKPVASGAELVSGRMASADALQLAAASQQVTAYADLNPFCLEVAVSPHIAAKFADIEIDIAKIVTISAKLRAASDLLLIEGAGGWYTPIGERESMADLARALGCPVILVVGLKLGCLNHARLSVEAIRRSGCPFAGWIGSHTDPDFMALAENLATLRELLGAEPLGLLPHSAHNESDAAHLHEALLQLLASRQRQIT